MVSFRSILFPFFYLLALQSIAQERCPLKEEKYNFRTGALIKDTVVFGEYNLKRDTGYFHIETQGPGILFSYTRSFDCPDAFDEQYSDHLKWSVPDNRDSFKIIFTTDGTRFPNVDYYFGGNRTYDIMLSGEGFISGIKVGNDWNVSVSLIISAGKTGMGWRRTRIFQFSRTFMAEKSRKKKYKNKEKD